MLRERARIEEAVLEVVFPHLFVRLIAAPTVVSDAIDRNHFAGPMTPTFAVNEHWPVGRIIN